MRLDRRPGPKPERPALNRSGPTLNHSGPTLNHSGPTLNHSGFAMAGDGGATRSGTTSGKGGVVDLSLDLLHGHGTTKFQDFA